MKEPVKPFSVMWAGVGWVGEQLGELGFCSGSEVSVAYTTDRTLNKRSRLFSLIGCVDNILLATITVGEHSLSKRGLQKMGDSKPLGPIKTIVVLVMENRSFDHMLGWQKQINPEINGVTGKESNPLSTTVENCPVVYFSNEAQYFVSDPGHSFQATREQIFGSADTSANPPPMNGFAQQAESIKKGLSKTVMSGFRPETLPVHTTLLKEFAVFDRWFASVPSSTQPNRQFIHSATSHGLTTNLEKTLISGLPQKTIFDNIYNEGLTFGIYYQSLPSTFFYKRLRQLKYLDAFHRYNPAFKCHAEAGKLPNYVVLEPQYFQVPLLPGNDDHPPHDIVEGQKLIKEVYEILRSSPQWNDTLLIITYDEHGGFYDHIPTPTSNVPSPDGIVGPEPFHFKFDRLGVRVPTIMISPWIDKGTVVHAPNGPTSSSEFEHSSIPATVKKIFNLEADFLSNRDAWAGTFEGVVMCRSTPRTDCPEVLQDPLQSTINHDCRTRGSHPLSEFQVELVQLAANLNGDDKSKDLNLKMGESMTEHEASNYINNALNQFLHACQSAIQDGADGSAIVSVKPDKIGGKKAYDVESL